MNKILALLSENPSLCERVLHLYYLTPNFKSVLREMPHCQKIPHFPIIWHRFCQISHSEYEVKLSMFENLINETGLNKEHTPKNILERLIVVSSSIKQLQEFNLIKGFHMVEKSLLSHLDPFPFNRKKIMLSKNQNESDLTIIEIRDAIEKQYLAWKFNIELNTVKYLCSKLSSCFYKYRSMGALRENIRLLETLPGSTNLSDAEKVYLLNQKPFDINSVTSFEPNIAGLNWQVLADICPKIFTHSHEYILFLVTILKKMHFTEVQIQKCLPFFYLSFYSFIMRLNHILSIEAMAKYRNDENFLLLLSYGLLKLKILVAEGADYRHLMVSVQNHYRASKKNFVDFISDFISADSKTKALLANYSREFKVSPIQMQETLEFLKGLQFTNAEISEAVKILFYSRDAISKALAKVESEAENLEKYGFHKGCVQEETNFFKCGSKEKNKLLQLCLYYLEIEEISEKKEQSEKTDLIFFNYEIIPD